MDLNEKIEAPRKYQNNSGNNKLNNSWQALRQEIEGCDIDDSEDEETTELIQDSTKNNKT